MNPVTIPDGYWQDANGNLIPESKVKDIDKLRHQVVMDLCLMAEQQSQSLAKFKALAMQDVAALVATGVWSDSFTARTTLRLVTFLVLGSYLGVIMATA